MEAVLESQVVGTGTHSSIPKGERKKREERENIERGERERERRKKNQIKTDLCTRGTVRALS